MQEFKTKVKESKKKETHHLESFELSRKKNDFILPSQIPSFFP